VGVEDAVKFNGLVEFDDAVKLVNGGEVDGERRTLQVRRDNSSSVTDSVPPDLSLGSRVD
jgi:hypothetical protein